ncbi:MAG: hypothetical protein QGH82_02755 [Candidatus Woesearchaeota archaeon]|nr:hypothetical protein [Candidatus Woesearchaeota archaeon]
MTLDARPYVSQTSSSSSTQWNLSATPYTPRNNIQEAMLRLDDKEEPSMEDGDVSFHTCVGAEEEKTTPLVEEEEEGMSFYTCSEQPHDETMTIFVEMAGAEERERLVVREDTVIVEALAKMMGVTNEFIVEKFCVIYEGRLVDTTKTVMEVGLQDQTDMVMTPKLKGGGERRGHTREDDPTTKKKRRG